MPQWLMTALALFTAMLISAMVVAPANRWEAVNFSKNSMGWDTFYLLDRLTGGMQQCTVDSPALTRSLDDRASRCDQWRVMAELRQ